MQHGTLYHHSGSRRALEPKKHRNTRCAREKRRGDWKKDLQIRGAGGKSRKRPTLFVGEKSNGKSLLIHKYGENE
jgi:hypothetical protein